VVKNVPLWIACEVSCRIQVREFKDPVRRGKHLAQKYPVRILRWKRLAADGLHPKAALRLPVVVPPPLPVVTRAPDPLAELGSRSGNAFVSTLRFKL
jgi:hypothetical protein